MNMHVPALQRSLSEIVADYDQKRAGIGAAVKTFEQAGNALKMAVTVDGTFGNVSIDVGHVYARDLESCLLKSAWMHVYSGLDIDRIASAEDKRKWQMAIEKPPEFTLDNIRGTFGHYLLDPRGNILRGLAEVFCSLDQAYKSHRR